MTTRTKARIADAVVTIALVVFAVLTFSHLHGWRLWLAFVGYCAAIIALGYLTDDITRAKGSAEEVR